MNVFIEIRLVVAPPLYLSRPCPARALLCTSHQQNLNPQEEVTSLLGIFNRSFISQQLFRDANANSYANIIFSQKCEYWIMLLYYHINIWHERFLLDDLAGCQALQMFQSLLLSNYGGFTNSSATDRLPFTASNSFYSCVGLFVVFGLNICNNILISTYIKGWLFNEERIKYKYIHEDRLYQTCPISYSA